MPNVTTRYVIYASRRRRRMGGGVIDIQMPGNSSLATGDTYQLPPGFPNLPWTDSNGVVHDLKFAFWSVTGGANGPVMSFPGQASPSIPVGDQPIVATAWYVDLSGDGPGGPGITIDAFDMGIGDFVLDDFVTCNPGDAAFNEAANWDGFVPTEKAEVVTAYGHISGGNFDKWDIAVVIAPAITASNMNLDAGLKSVAYAFAIYKPSSIVIGKRPDQYRIGTWVSWGVMVDGGGPTGNGPVGPWDPLIQQFAAGMALMEVAMKADKSLAGDIMAMAAKQVELAGREIAKKMKAVKFK